ncbi:MAG: GNAT family N-acetyltransferase [Oscillospiraceae bacterium]
MQEENIKLRPATFKDAKLLFDWSTGFYIQKNEFFEDDITWEKHELWLKRKLQDSNCFMFICMLQKVAIGKLQVNVVNRIGNIDFMVAPEARKKSYGTKIIGLAAKAV